MFSIRNEGNDVSPAEQCQQVATSILLMEQGFQLQTEKLKTARHSGIVSDTEYKQWVDFAELLSNDMLERDLSNSENVCYLKIMAALYYEMIMGLKLTAK